MKKLIAMMLLCSLVFSACGNTNDTDQSQTEQSQTAPETTVAETEAVSETSADTSDTAEISDTSEASLPSDDETATDSSGNSPLADAVSAVTDAVEWPAMEQITDPDIALEFFKLDLNNPNYNDIIIMQCPMSAVMAEIIVINAQDVDSAKEDLLQRQAKMRETDAFYPNDVEVAEKSIVGVSGNFVYFIAGTNAAESEEILAENLQ